MVMLDFERAAINAIEAVFDDGEVSGCFFHFCQCIYRNIQSQGLQQFYNDDPNFAQNMHCLAAFASIPVADVVYSFKLLKEFPFFESKTNGTSEEDRAVQRVLSYMENNWVGVISRLSYIPGAFSLKLSNVFELTLSLYARTNNAVEAWHNAIRLIFGIHHPNIFRFINGIKLEQDAAEILIAQSMAGINIERSNKTVEQAQERILNVVKSYKSDKSFDLQKYLLGISQSIHLPK